jgi:hypothetical protein
MAPVRFCPKGNVFSFRIFMRSIFKIQAIRSVLIVAAMLLSLPVLSFSQGSTIHHGLSPAISQTRTILHAPTQAVSVYRQEDGQSKSGEGSLPSSVGPSPLIQSLTGSMPEQVQTQIYNSGDPTDEEQYELELINRARANPQAEGERLDTTTDPDVVAAYKYWGSPTPSEVKSAFAAYPAQPPLAFNADLITAARLHSQDMLQNNFENHTGSDGSSPFDRMNNAGYLGWDAAGENIFAYGTSLWDTHASFNIDFGNPGLGHRQNIMNFTGAVYTEIGIGIIDGGSGGGNVGPMITTEDFGTIPGNTFILGVVYNDKNHNNFYDPGEGISGVTITATGADYSAVTSSSGGYAIPYTANGTVSVTAALPGGSVTQHVDFNGVNVKVDFTLNGLPGDVTLLTPGIDTTIGQTGELFTWAMDTGATQYNIQIGTDSLMSKSKLVVNDSIISTLSYQAINLKDTTTYYWRMRAKNAKGWGAFSAVQAFTVILPPNRVTLTAPANDAAVSDSATFIWQPTAPDVTQYWLQISTSSQMKTPFVVSDTLDASITTDTASLARLSPGATYYWQVLAENDGGWSVPSTVRSFTTAASSVTPSGENGLSFISISPNPTMSLAHIYFTLAASQDVSLHLFNNVGDEVKSIALGTRPAGRNEYDFDGSSLAAGTYSIELWIGNREESIAHEGGRIVLIK